jgi:hypothetical protein
MEQAYRGNNIGDFFTHRQNTAYDDSYRQNLRDSGRNRCRRELSIGSCPPTEDKIQKSSVPPEADTDELPVRSS